MTSNPTIAALRKHIGQQEKATSHNWPIAGLGDPALDRSLPDKGLATGALYEFLPGSYADVPATLGFGIGVLARILSKRKGYILWIQPSCRSCAESMLYPIGLGSFGIDPNRLIHVSVPKAQNVLWALDEALAHDAVAAAVGLIPESDRAYNFTASRRLSMRAANHGATALIFSGKPAFAMATAAEMRWSVTAGPSPPMHRTGQTVAGLGPPRWNVCVAKSRRGNAGRWHIEWNHETLSFRLVTPLADRAPFWIPGAETGKSAAA